MRALASYTLQKNLHRQDVDNASFGLYAADSLFRLTGWFHIHLFLFTNQRHEPPFLTDLYVAGGEESVLPVEVAVEPVLVHLFPQQYHISFFERQISTNNKGDGNDTNVLISSLGLLGIGLLKL